MTASDPPVPEVIVRRSARRRRTISARWEGERIVVMMPVGLSAAEEQRQIDALVRRLTRRRTRRIIGDDALQRRADEIAQGYLDGRVQATSVRWVTNQNTRWASITLATGAMRISHRLQGAPEWVLDNVLLHELAHLIEPGHGPAFQALAQGHPRHPEAEAFLAGMSFAAGQGTQPWPADE